jgi:hypothetical protein
MNKIPTAPPVRHIMENKLKDIWHSIYQVDIEMSPTFYFQTMGKINALMIVDKILRELGV